MRNRTVGSSQLDLALRLRPFNVQADHEDRDANTREDERNARESAKSGSRTAHPESVRSRCGTPGG